MSILLPDLPGVQRAASVPQPTARCQAQGREGKPRFPKFQRLPTELIVLVMWHTKFCDLRNMIKTGKSMNQIFKENQTSIFKRVQICQYPEFSGWFGGLPGFDGTTRGKSRTSEQVQCLRRLVICLDWGVEIATPSVQRAALASLDLLDQYGGWRYLYFLQAMKDHMEDEAKKLWQALHLQINSMSEALAKSTVFCLARISWRGSRLLEVLGEENTVAELPEIVKGRLKLFQQEPQIVQEMVLATLKFLVCRIARHLGLPETALAYSRWFYRDRVGFPLSATQEEYLHDFTSQMLACLLLQCCFSYELGIALQLCEEPVRDSVRRIQSWIQQYFKHYCVALLRTAILGTAPRFGIHVFMGSLWAKGLEFPARNLFKDAMCPYSIPAHGRFPRN